MAEIDRAIVIGKARGPDEALVSLELSASRQDPGGYNLLHLTRGHLIAETGGQTNGKRFGEAVHLKEAA